MSFYVEEAAFEALRYLSRYTHVPQQEYLRQGLDYILRKHRPQIIGSPGEEARRKLLNLSVILEKTKLAAQAALHRSPVMTVKHTVRRRRG